MKNVLITVVSALSFFLPMTVNADGNGTTLRLQNQTYSGVILDDTSRDACFCVSVELIESMHLIRVQHLGIGDGEVSIYDQNNQLVDQILFYSGTFMDYISTPSQSGSYKLVIWSDRYYGEAYFKI